MVRFCPLCGKPDSQMEFHGELCVPCAESRMKDLPNVKVMFCPKCHSLIDKGRKKKDATLSEEVIRLLRLKGKNALFDEEKGEIEYDTEHGRIRRKVLLLIDKNQCADCDRSGSQYFEAIIQLRGDGKKVEKMAGSLVRKLEQRTFVPKIEELHEGLDIYCGSRNEAIAALNAFSLPYVRTEKLAGQRDGKRLYRTTLLVRL
jgi:NMD protein affecting ribosome stability and mRNA decay